jgi:hypothetical protein
MRKFFVPILFILACAFYACKKDSVSAKEQYSKLIVGTWKTQQQNTKICDVSSNELLKDSTVNFDDENSGRSWSEIFTTDGNAYVATTSRKLGATIATTDTTTYASYSILGSNLTVKQLIVAAKPNP